MKRDSRGAVVRANAPDVDDEDASRKLRSRDISFSVVSGKLSSARAGVRRNGSHRARPRALAAQRVDRDTGDAPASAAVRSRAGGGRGGFVGSTALHSQRAGRHVTLLEAGPDVGGRHSASTNAGTFAFYANVPVQRPGLWKEAPG